MPRDDTKSGRSPVSTNKTDRKGDSPISGMMSALAPCDDVDGLASLGCHDSRGLIRVSSLIRISTCFHLASETGGKVPRTVALESIE